MLSKNKVCLYNALSRLNTNELSHIIKHIDSNGIESLCECVFNTIYTDLKLSKRNKNKIKKNFIEKKSLRNLKTITDKSKDISKKRKALLQEGKGIGLILSSVVPILASLISKAVSK
jgi:hypothetical protein